MVRTLEGQVGLAWSSQEVEGQEPGELGRVVGCPHPLSWSWPFPILTMANPGPETPSFEI